MQKVVYRCDWCVQEMGQKKHLSLQFSNYSGVAIPPNQGKSNGWRIAESLQCKFMHFCNAKCLQKHFSNLMKIAK